MNTNEFAKVFTINNENLNLISSHFSNTREETPYIIISPTESVYYMICNPNHTISYELFKKLTNRNHKYEFFVYNFELARVLIDINEKEENILRVICNSFWNNSIHPDTLSICIKSSSYVNPDYTYHINKKPYITLNYSNNQCIKKLQEYSMMPLISQVLYINDIPCSHFNQLISYYENINVNILKSDDACNRSCLPTQIILDDNTIWITNRGHISSEEILKVLLENGLSDIEIKYHECVKLLPFNNTILKTNLNKSIYLLKWIDIDNGEPDEILNELKIKTQNYFNHVVFVDFNGRHKSMINYCYAYIDISEHGDLNEAIKNIYYILHSVLPLSNIKTILFFDAYTHHINNGCNNLFNVLIDMIYKYTGKNIIMIPIKYIPEQHLKKENVIEEDCMECMD